MEMKDDRSKAVFSTLMIITEILTKRDNLKRLEALIRKYKPEVYDEKNKKNGTQMVC